MIAIIFTSIIVLFFTVGSLLHSIDEVREDIEDLKLRVNIIEFNNSSSDDSKWDKELEKMQGVAIWFIFAIFAVMAGAVNVYYVFEKDKIEHVADFLAYIFPCIAGVSGGLGLFYRKNRPDIWFWISGILIIAGIISYFISKSESRLVWWSSYGLVGLLFGVTWIFLDVRNRGLMLFDLKRFSRVFVFLGSIVIYVMTRIYVDLARPEITWSKLSPIEREVGQWILRIGKEMKW